MARTTYDEETVRLAMTQVALCAGNCRDASQRMSELGAPVPQATIKAWTSSRQSLLDELRAEVIPKINQRIARRAEDLAERYARIEEAMAQRLEDELDSLQPKELSRSIKDVAISRGISTEKALLMRNQPMALERHQSAQELLRALAQHLGQTFEGEAEEITDADEPKELAA